MNEEKKISIYQLVAFSIDFEGSISCIKSSSKSRIYYMIKVRIHNTCLRLLHEFQKVIEIGQVFKCKTTGKNQKLICHYWEMSHGEVRRHLPLIEPFLIQKKEHAKLAIEFLNIMKTASVMKSMSNEARLNAYTNDEIVLMEVIYQEMKELTKEYYDGNFQ